MMTTASCTLLDAFERRARESRPPVIQTIDERAEPDDPRAARARLLDGAGGAVLANEDVRTGPIDRW